MYIPFQTLIEINKSVGVPIFMKPNGGDKVQFDGNIYNLSYRHVFSEKNSRNTENDRKFDFPLSFVRGQHGSDKGAPERDNCRKSLSRITPRRGHVPYEREMV